MAEECIYCDGSVICDDPADCEDAMTHEELIANNYKHMGCFCVGLIGGLPKLVECGSGSPEQMMSVYRNGNRIKIIEVSACP